MHLDIKYVVLLTVFSVIVVHGKIQGLKTEVGDPKLEHFAKLHNDETATSQPNEDLPNENEPARNNRYIRSAQLKRSYKENSLSFRRLERNIQEKKAPVRTHVLRLIKVHNNIPRGYFLDPRGRPRVYFS